MFGAVMEARRASADIFSIIGEAQRIASSDIFDSLRRMADEIGDVEGEGEVSETGMAALDFAINRPEFLALSIYDKVKALLDIGVKHPTTRSVVIFFALSFVVWLFEECCELVKQHYFGTEKPAQVVREIRTIVVEAKIPPLELQGYRVVAKDTLIARHSHRSKSAHICTLYCGQVVRLVEKRSKRSLVEWQDEGKPIRGWVLSKYLKRLTK